MNLTTQLHLVPRSKNAWSYNSSPPIGLHGVVLNQAVDTPSWRGT